MGMWIGRNRKARVTYGFDEIALVPGRVTINPNEVDITFRLPRKAAEPLELKIPILASAMDGVVDVGFAIAMNKLGGLAVLNLEGVQTRYKNPPEVLQKIVEASKSEITALLQRIYQEPIQQDLIAARVRQIKDAGVVAAVSSIPQRAAEFGKIAQEAGADVFVVQSTVSTVRHISSEYKSLDLEKFCREMRIPVIVGNTVGYDVTFEIMECGPVPIQLPEPDYPDHALRELVRPQVVLTDRPEGPSPGGTPTTRPTSRWHERPVHRCPLRLCWQPRPR